MNSFTFGGINSKDMGLWVSGGGTYNAPSRDVESIQIPGRNGDIQIDSGRYLNIVVSYQGYIPYGFPRNAQAIRSWLLSQPIYTRLEDDYDADHYRLASFIAGAEFSPRQLNSGAETRIDFNCMPQRWLYSGDTPVPVQNGGKIFNPTLFPARPIITLSGIPSGFYLEIGGTRVQTVDSEWGRATPVIVDCENMDIRGSDGENLNIYFTALDFPVLKPGSNTITWGGSIDAVSVTPRWWEL